MNTFTELVGHTAGRIDALELFDAQVALDAGLDSATVNRWRRLHEVYFGKARSRRGQEVGRRKAIANGVSLAKLSLIERLIAHVEPDAEQWRLRHELLDIPGQYETLRKKAAEIVPPKEPAAPEPGVWCSRTFRGGMGTIRINTDQRDVADLDHWLRDGIDPDLPAAPQMLERFTTLLRGSDTPRVPVGTYRPIVAVPIDAHLSVTRGTGAGDTVLTATDGTTITLKELLDNHFAADLEVAAFHPNEGPLGLFRGSRFANDHQRDLLKLTHPRCTWEGCRAPADNCQMHHIRAWNRGGETSLENLLPLCAYHNGVNDDDPLVPRRGRVAAEGGWSRWISPRGYAVPTTPKHSAMRLLFDEPPDPPPNPPTRPRP